jgi:hypothetical protein
MIDRNRALGRSRRIASLGAVVVVGACGGGGSDDPAPPAGPTSAARIAAAGSTAQADGNACAPIRPFYWEIGDRTARLASGSVASATDPTVYTAASPLSIASASKWIYASYVVQRQGGVLSAADVKFLDFTSGYTSFSSCTPGQTVQACVDAGSNGVYHPATDGKFFYGGGHMQKHASLIGLGALANAALATEIRAQIGTDVALAYSEPQLAGGIVTSADNYAVFLRKILTGDLKMGELLGSNAVCTNPQTCATALATPAPAGESWHYSIGHWVEDDPAVGDGAFSSAGSFGFYPWIDAAKTTYGIVARRSDAGGGFDSVMCGRLIRKAWMSGIAQ